MNAHAASEAGERRTSAALAQSPSAAAGLGSEALTADLPRRGRGARGATEWRTLPRRATPAPEGAGAAKGRRNRTRTCDTRGVSAVL